MASKSSSFVQLVKAYQEYHGKGLDHLVLANTLNDKTSPDVIVYHKPKTMNQINNRAKYSRKVHLVRIPRLCLFFGNMQIHCRIGHKLSECVKKTCETYS